MPAISDSGGHKIRPVRQRHVLPWIWLTLAVVLGFFLLTEHQAHLFGALPFLLILLCPLMHVFMHHGHGSHGSGAGKDLPARPDREVKP